MLTLHEQKIPMYKECGGWENKVMKQISSGSYYSSSATVAGRTDQSAVQYLLRKGNEHTVCGSYAGYDWSFASPGERSATCQPCIDRATTPAASWLDGEEEAARLWLEKETAA